MSRAKTELGDRGEALACDYLTVRGWRVEARNWRWRHCEVDIIAFDSQGHCHVVEVKSRQMSGSVSVDELLSPHKQRCLLEAADAYAQQHEEVRWIQIDLLCIFLKGKEVCFEFYPDCVRPSFSS